MATLLYIITTILFFGKILLSVETLLANLKSHDPPTSYEINDSYCYDSHCQNKGPYFKKSLCVGIYVLL